MGELLGVSFIDFIMHAFQVLFTSENSLGILQNID